MKKILLTGGGTAGHVIPNIALMPSLKEAGFSISYIGSKDGMEKDILKDYDIPYYGVSVGKLRRYFDTKNFTDGFRILKGVEEANRIVRKIKPDIIFSKGGFVSFPVTVAGKTHKIPVVIHESDITPGLANKLAFPFCQKILTTFPETLEYVPKEKAEHTGSPIRKELFLGDRAAGLAFCGFDGAKPVLLVMGGSLGSVTVNNYIRQALPELTAKYHVVHIVGRGNLDPNFIGIKDYKQFEYVSQELPHIFCIADLIVSRAGSNAIFEFLALKKPNILIPLSQKASRGDQILNARSFQNQGFSVMIEEEKLKKELLLAKIDEVYQNRNDYIAKMEMSKASNAAKVITDILLKESK